MLGKARNEALLELGGLLVEMYRRGGFREDLLAERCAAVVGIDARLAEIEDLLHMRSRNVPRCECGAAVLRGSHFCPNCGRTLDSEGGSSPDVPSEETVLAAED
jgi:predicted amidophosphoribosyltransferase